LLPAYAIDPPAAAPSSSARASSPARQLAQSSPFASGTIVAEFDEIATAAGSTPRASAPRRPSSTATAPKKFTATTARRSAT
jgi:hypothetical protein